MEISTSKTEELQRSRNSVQYSLQVDGVSLKLVEKIKYLGFAFTSDGRQDKEFKVCSGKTNAVIRALYHSVVLKRELSRKIKLLGFRSIFVPILTYGHESWKMIKNVWSQMQAFEIKFFKTKFKSFDFDKLVALRFENCSISIRYLSVSKAISIHNLAMYAKFSVTAFQVNLGCQSE